MDKFILASIFLFLLLPPAWASESVTHGSEMFFFVATREFSTDAQFALESTLAVSSSDPPRQIFIPRGPAFSASDLPDAVYMCPGSLNINTNPSGKFYLSRFSGESLYFLPNTFPRKNFACLAANNFVDCQKLEYPWPSGELGLNSDIQWSTSSSPTLLQRMQSDDDVEYTIDQNLWNAINTNAKVNVNYYPALGNEFYPSNTAKAGVACTGSESLTLDSGSGIQNLVRSDGKISPAALDSPLSSRSWSLPRFGNNHMSTITLNGVPYEAQMHRIEGDISQSLCHGAIQTLPFVGDVLDLKYSYLRGETGFSSNPPLDFNVYVIDPKTCKLDAAISPTKIIPPLVPGEARLFTVSVYNKYDLFDMVATDVQVVPPAYGWSARKSTNPPQSSTYTPKNGFDSIIASRETRQLYIDVIVPDPLQQIPGNELCLDITLESNVEFCGGNKCTDTTRVCIEIDPSFYCNVTAIPDDIALEPGDDIILETQCFLDNNPTPCPELTWEATGFYNLDGTQNISLMSLRDIDSILPDSEADYRDTLNTYPKPPPFSPEPKIVVTNSPAIQYAGLFTYKDYPDVTVATDLGDVKVSGIDAQGEPFECTVQGTMGDFITVEDLAKPDYEPILQPKRISGTPENDDEVFEITWGSINTGGSAAITITTVNLELAPSYFTSKILSPLAVGEQKTWIREFACPHPGTFPARVITDPLNRIEEEPPNGELNNEAFARINCGNVLVCADLV